MRIWRTFLDLPPGFNILAAVLAVALVVVSCAAEQPGTPTPSDPPRVQGLPEDVWTFCDHGHRVYVARNNPSGIALWGVPNDPVCAAGAG